MSSGRSLNVLLKGETEGLPDDPQRHDGCAPDHVRPVDGVDYDQVETERLEKTPQSAVREVLRERAGPLR